LEPPHLEVEGINPNGGIVCPACGSHTRKESIIYDNCGFKLYSHLQNQ
jgi:hypothetical protein